MPIIKKHSAPAERLWREIEALHEPRSLSSCAFFVFLLHLYNTDDYAQALANDWLATALANINLFADSTAEFAQFLSSLCLSDELPADHTKSGIMRVVAQLIRLPLMHTLQNELNNLVNTNLGKRNDMLQASAVLSTYLFLLWLSFLYSRQLAPSAQILNQYKRAREAGTWIEQIVVESDDESDEPTPIGGLLSRAPSFDWTLSPSPPISEPREYDDQGFPVHSAKSTSSLEKFLIDGRDAMSPEYSETPPTSNTPVPVPEVLGKSISRKGSTLRVSFTPG